MKRIKLIAVLFILCSAVSVQAQELTSAFLFDLELTLDPPQAIGPVLKGTRMIFPFKEGNIKGEIINGKLLSGGGEWGLAVDSTTFKMDCRATIKTDDGALIYIAYTGYNYADPKTRALLSSGKGVEVSPADYYFRSVPVFETSAPKYAWLNHTVAVGVGRFTGPGQLVYRIYTIK